MHSTVCKPEAPIYESLTEAAFQLAQISVDEAVVRRTAATLARLADGMGAPSGAGGSQDFMEALRGAAA